MKAFDDQKKYIPPVWEYYVCTFFNPNLTDILGNKISVDIIWKSGLVLFRLL